MILRVSARALELENDWFQRFFKARAGTLFIKQSSGFFLPLLNKPVLGHLISDNSFLYQKLTDFDIG